MAQATRATARRVDRTARGAARGRDRSQPPAALGEAWPRTAVEMQRLHATMGNQAMARLLRSPLMLQAQSAVPPRTTFAPIVQRELKIDSYEWSWVGVPGVRLGYRWATGAEDLFNKLKKAFETDLPAAVKVLEASGESDLKQLAQKLRDIQTRYDDVELVYKKTTGKLSGEGLDAELGPLLTQAQNDVSSRKQTLARAIRQSFATVGSYIGAVTSLKSEYERINALVPKGSDGASLEVATLKKLATDAAAYERNMQVEIGRLQSAKQNTAPSTPSKAPATTVSDPVKDLCIKRGWNEKDRVPVLIDPSDPAIKLEVLGRVVGDDLNRLTLIMGRDKLTMEGVHRFLFDHGVRTIKDLNAYLVQFKSAQNFDATLRVIGVEGLNELEKAGVPRDFAANHAGKSVIEIVQEYRSSLTVAPPTAANDPFTAGVDPNKDPLTYSRLEAYVQFHLRRMGAVHVNMILHHTYQSRYESENGIGAEYWPNGAQAAWVVHVHRGPNGGLKVGSVKTWADRRTVGHSLKLTVEQLTTAGVPHTDATWQPE